MDLQIFVDALKNQGILGVFLLGSLYVIYRLATRYDALQEKRIEEALESHKIMTDLTQAVRDLAAAQRNNNR